MQFICQAKQPLDKPFESTMNKEENVRRSQRISSQKVTNYKVEWPRFTLKKRKQFECSANILENAASEQLPLNQNAEWQPVQAAEAVIIELSSEDVLRTARRKSKRPAGQSNESPNPKKPKRGRRPAFKVKCEQSTNTNNDRSARSSGAQRNRCTFPEKFPELGISAPLLQPIKIERYYDNSARHPLTTSSATPGKPVSILPAVYPSHFVNQRPLDHSLTLEAALAAAAPPHRNSPRMELFPTPELSRSYEFVNEASSSPSLSESLRGIFHTDDIREILSIERVAYRLGQHHVAALASVLQIGVDNLTKVLEIICELDAVAVERMLKDKTTLSPAKCSAPVAAVSATAIVRSPSILTVSSASSSSSAFIEISPNAKVLQRRYFPSQRRSH